MVTKWLFPPVVGYVGNGFKTGHRFPSLRLWFRRYRRETDARRRITRESHAGGCIRTVVLREQRHCKSAAPEKQGLREY